MFACSICSGEYKARFLQLDTAATAASPGYDDVLGEPNLQAADADDPLGSVGRTNTTHELTCQVDVTQASDRLRQSVQGKARGARYEITVPRRQLVMLGLIDANGESMIRTGAKLDRILDRAGNLVLAFPDPPGLYVEEIIYDGWTDAAFGICVYICTPRERAF